MRTDPSTDRTSTIRSGRPQSSNPSHALPAPHLWEFSRRAVILNPLRRFPLSPCGGPPSLLPKRIQMTTLLKSLDTILLHRRALSWTLILASLAVRPPIARGDERETIPPPDNRREVVETLAAWIETERERLDIPAISIAVVEDQTIVWARGFGWEDQARTRPATGHTVHRVASVSKLYTATAALRLVERGQLDLDAAVERFVAEWRPTNPFDQPITLRHLMSHRSGLVREPLRGGYFDPVPVSLADSVASLNATRVLFRPGDKLKYSNAGVAVVGLAVERAAGEPFALHLKRTVFEPLGMNDSDFDPDDALKARIAQGIMATDHGTTFPAPNFTIGTVPAGNLASTVLDQAKFLSALFRGGGGVISSQTLEQMITPQFADRDSSARFGLGFVVRNDKGRRRIGHDGAVYGFATHVSALIDDKLGVAVVATRDCANALADRIADETLDRFLAAREGKTLPPPVSRTILAPERARDLAGVYTDGTHRIELYPRNGRLIADAKGADRLWELRAEGATLVVDGPTARGASLVPLEDAVVGDGRRLDRIEPPAPLECPADLADLLGEYGPDHNILALYEEDQQLFVRIEWFFRYPLKRIGPDEFAFPDFGLYHDETLRIERDDQGAPAAVLAGSFRFARRKLDGDGATFRVEPLEPVAVLRERALKATPPVETGEFRRPDLVALDQLDPTLKLDIRYATDNNFLGAPFYDRPAAYLQRPAAEALVRAHRLLESQGLGLLIYDAYRPWFVTRMFWDGTPAAFHDFVADPAKGSRHNRGCAVDLTLYDRTTGQPVRMVAGFDEFSNRAAAWYPGGTARQRWARRVLWRAMTRQGFEVYEREWWHFDFQDWRAYPILNLTFEELETQRQPTPDHPEPPRP